MRTSDSHGYCAPPQFADVKLVVENQPKGPEEQLLGRRTLVLSALGTTNSDLVRSDHSEGVLRAGHDSDSERMDYGDCHSEGDSSPERCHGPVLAAARRLLREARDMLG